MHWYAAHVPVLDCTEWVSCWQRWDTLTRGGRHVSGDGDCDAHVTWTRRGDRHVLTTMSTLACDGHLACTGLVVMSAATGYTDT
jgi:hypothetical protein